MWNPRRLALLLAALLGLAIGWAIIADRAPPETPPFTPESEDGPVTETRPDLLDAQPGRTGSASATDTPRTAQGKPLDAALTGLVLDSEDRPLPGARVEVRPIDPEGLRGAPYPDGAVLGHTLSDRDGSFRLPAAFGGWLRLIASAPGRAMVGRRVASTGGHVVLRLPPAASLHVSVLDVEGQAIPEAIVSAALGDTRQTGRTNNAGVLELDAMPPGTARLRVGAAGFGFVNAGPFVVRAGAPAQAIVVLPRGIRIRGTVRDAETGAPLAKAEVYIAHPGRADRAEPTGGDGRYGPVPGGGLGERVFVSVHAAGYAPRLEAVVLNAEAEQIVDVGLERAEAWRGQVLTAGGQPAAGARVAYTAEGVAGRPPDTTTSDAKGRFTLPPPPAPAPGRRVVLTATLGQATAALALRPDSLRPDPLHLRLIEGTRVEGRVVGVDGAPLQGVLVRLSPAWEEVGDRRRPDAATSLLLAANEAGFVGLSTASGPEGHWSLSAVPAGPFRVSFAWPGGSKWRAKTLLVTGPLSDAGRETLGAGGRLVGRVMNAGGQPIAGARLRLEPSTDSRHTHVITSGPGGWFEFAGVGAGAMRLRATFGALAPVEVNVETAAEGEQRLDIRFEEGAVLAGRVTHRGSPYRGLLTVSLRRDGRARADRAPFSLQVSEGRLRLTNVRVGRWLVEAHAPGGLFARSAVVEVDPARTTPLSLDLRPQASLTGIVRRDGGEPAPALRVTLEHEESGRRHLVTTDAAGRFRFRALAPGTWRIQVSGKGGAPIEDQVHLGVAEQATVELKLAAAGSLNVLVVDASGRALPSAVVLFRQQQRVVRSGGPLRTDRHGRLLKHDLPLGEIRVSARTVDGRTGSRVAEVERGRTTDVKITVGERGPR